jgi:hypothetical protein
MGTSAKKASRIDARRANAVARGPGKSLRNGVHRANGVVWEAVSGGEVRAGTGATGTHLSALCTRRSTPAGGGEGAG